MFSTHSLLIIISILLIPKNVLCNPKSLQNAYVESFKIYQKAIEIAHERNLTAEQNEELERILDEQPNVVYSTLRETIGIDGQIRHDIFHIFFFF